MVGDTANLYLPKVSEGVLRKLYLDGEKVQLYLFCECQAIRNWFSYSLAL